MSDRDILKSALSVTPECLPPEQLEALLDGKRSHPHLAQCSRCQAELALLKSFESGTPLPDEGAAVAWIGSHLDRQLETIKDPSRLRAGRLAVRTFEPRGSWLGKIFGLGGMRWVLPATAMAAVAIVAVILMRPAKEPELQANAGQTTVFRSQELQLVSPVGDVQQVPQELRWQAFTGSALYRVAVMEVDHSSLWTSETKETSVAIPAGVRAKILPGKPILWQVTALDGKGRVLVTSQVQRFASPRERESSK